MSYAGALTARSAREELGQALAALQEDPRTPPDVMGVAQNIAQVGKAFGLTRTPELPEIYDDRFLPPREERLPLK